MRHLISLKEQSKEDILEILDIMGLTPLEVRPSFPALRNPAGREM